MELNNIYIILVYIDEAHSTKWPLGLPYTPEPHKDINDRISQANYFYKKYSKFINKSKNLKVYIDTENNNFSERLHAWPDKFYYIDPKTFIIKYQSEYGSNKDALIDVDYADIIEKIINK